MALERARITQQAFEEALADNYLVDPQDQPRVEEVLSIPPHPLWQSPLLPLLAPHDLESACAHVEHAAGLWLSWPSFDGMNVLVVDVLEHGVSYLAQRTQSVRQAQVVWGPVQTPLAEDGAVLCGRYRFREMRTTVDPAHLTLDEEVQ